MKLRMQESHEKGVESRPVLSFALGIARCPAKRNTGIGGLGIEFREVAIGTPTLWIWWKAT